MKDFFSGHKVSSVFLLGVAVVILGAGAVYGLNMNGYTTKTGSTDMVSTTILDEQNNPVVTMAAPGKFSIFQKGETRDPSYEVRDNLPAFSDGTGDFVFGLSVYFPQDSFFAHNLKEFMGLAPYSENSVTTEKVGDYEYQREGGAYILFNPNLMIVVDMPTEAEYKAEAMDILRSVKLHGKYAEK